MAVKPKYRNTTPKGYVFCCSYIFKQLALQFCFTIPNTSEDCVLVDANGYIEHFTKESEVYIKTAEDFVKSMGGEFVDIKEGRGYFDTLPHSDFDSFNDRYGDFYYGEFEDSNHKWHSDNFMFIGFCGTMIYVRCANTMFNLVCNHFYNIFSHERVVGKFISVEKWDMHMYHMGKDYWKAFPRKETIERYLLKVCDRGIEQLATCTPDSILLAERILKDTTELDLKLTIKGAFKNPYRVVFECDYEDVVPIRLRFLYHFRPKKTNQNSNNAPGWSIEILKK